jgi:hypothetical protein
VGLPGKSLSIVAVLSVVAVFIWQSRYAPTTRSLNVQQDPHPPVTRVLSDASATSTTPLVPSARAFDLRAQFRKSQNYAALVREFSAQATAGNPTAEYLTARALKYCSDTIRLHFRNPEGLAKTRNEVEVRVGKYPIGLQQEILEAYDRCHEFLADSSQSDLMLAWENWLNKSSAAGYPPAESLKADLSRQADLMHDAASASAGDIVPPTYGPARDLALRAVLSGNPDSIFEMMNWVDGTKHSMDESADLLGAWQLLACQRGYDDCGPTSEWLRSMCNWDPQCANDSSVTDYLMRRFGSRFDDVQNLANSIGLAIDQKNQQAVEYYL